MEDYIIQVKNRYVGISAVWWAKDGKGFTTDPYDAQTYTEDKARTYEISCDVVAWYRDDVLHLAEHHVDTGKLIAKAFE